MIHETENPQKAKSIYPGKPARHALGMLRLVRVDTLRGVNNVGFLVERLNYITIPLNQFPQPTHMLEKSRQHVYRNTSVTMISFERPIQKGS